MAYTYKYPRPAVTADCVVITKEAKPKVLLISPPLMNLSLSPVRMMPQKLSGSLSMRFLLWPSTMRTSCRMLSMLYSYIMYMKSFENESLYLLWMFCVSIIKETKAIMTFIHIAAIRHISSKRRRFQKSLRFWRK